MTYEGPLDPTAERREMSGWISCKQDRRSPRTVVPPPQRRAVFIQDFQILKRPYNEIAAQMVADPRTVLGGGLDTARAAGEQLAVKVGPLRWPAVLAKTVEINLGPIRTHGDALLIGFAWRARGGLSLLPRLEADIEIAPLGPSQSEIVLRGRYEPPGGTIGEKIDELLLHRLADSTIRSFLRAVCSELENGQPGPNEKGLSGADG
jgi:hypothetical protein